MKKIKNKRAFTLIELLIVVLIIGILAAVAVPQYQKAVWKSRYTQAKTMAKSIANAEEIYFLTNGSYTADMYALDAELTSILNTSCTTEEERQTKEICYYYTSWGLCQLDKRGQVACRLYKDKKGFLEHNIFLPHFTLTSFKGKTYCVALDAYKGRAEVTATDLNYQICAEETRKSTPISTMWTTSKGFLY